MAIPTLTPPSETSRIILPSTGSSSEVTESVLPYGTYINSNLSTDEINEYISGSVAQVSYVYRMLGGGTLDIELSTYDVYTAYEDACLEYSSIVNLHQAKNSLPNLLGQPTASFDHEGEYLSGSLSSSLNGANAALKYPKFTFNYSKRFSDGIGSLVGYGGLETVYSASITTTASVQNYDLQTVVENLSQDSTQGFYNKVNGKHIRIKKVYYKSPRASWRFYGFWGGLLSVGNLSTYGQYADDHTFQIVPAWQNKLQAANYEDTLNVRISHYSYQLRNNQLRIYPAPDGSFTNIWIEFAVDENPLLDGDSGNSGVDGVNNVNTLPFSNIPYKSINSMGKHWIKRYALATCKCILAQNRGKFQTLPIPGESVTLNHSDLMNQCKDEKRELKEELNKVLDELTYAKISEIRANETDNVNKTLGKAPMFIYMG